MWGMSYNFGMVVKDQSQTEVQHQRRVWAEYLGSKKRSQSSSVEEGKLSKNNNLIALY